MKRIFRNVVVLVCALGLMLAFGGASLVASGSASAASGRTSARPKPPPDHYKVPSGVKFNEPYNRGGRHYYTVRRHIIRTINSTAHGDHIMIASWNIRGRVYADALIAAHRRGVGVRVILDRGNANPKAPNPDVNRMIRAFAGDGGRLPKNRSSVRRCASSCRGGRGIAHSKFFLFDHVGSKRWITMYGSNNATDVAANSQWNDMYTVTGNWTVYHLFNNIFDQMHKDRNLRSKAYVHRQIGFRAFNFYPFMGPGTKTDPDLARLRRTNCSGATGGTGTRGHTKVRIAQDALLGARGMAIAKRLVTMHRRGCDIRVIYSLLGGRIRRVMAAGHVPMLQYSYDRNRDGMYDIYLHMKAMAISGNFNGQSNTRVVFNGTANWTGVALASDEVVGEIHSRSVMNSYINWIDWMWHHRPARWGPDNLAATGTAERQVVTRDGRVVTRREPRVDPYALMRREGL